MSETKTVRLSDLVNVYESDYKTPTGKKLKLKPITTGQLKTLLIYENETNPLVIEDALDSIISTSVTTPEFNIDDLTLNDRLDLMLELRCITKGSVYTFTHKCGDCGGETIVSKNLKELTFLPVKETSLTLEITDRLSIVMEFPTRGCQKKAHTYQGACEPDVELDSRKMADIATTVMAYSIRDVIIDGESVDEYKGDNEIEEKIYMLENLTRGVQTELSNFYETNRYGTDFDFPFNCIHCGKPYNMTLPVTDFFV